MLIAKRMHVSSCWLLFSLSCTVIFFKSISFVLLWRTGGNWRSISLCDGTRPWVCCIWRCGLFRCTRSIFSTIALRAEITNKFKHVIAFESWGSSGRKDSHCTVHHRTLGLGLRIYIGLGLRIWVWPNSLNPWFDICHPGWWVDCERNS